MPCQTGQTTALVVLMAVNILSLVTINIAAAVYDLLIHLVTVSQFLCWDFSLNGKVTLFLILTESLPRFTLGYVQTSTRGRNECHSCLNAMPLLAKD